MKTTNGVAVTILILCAMCPVADGQGNAQLIETARANARAVAALQPARKKIIPQASPSVPCPPGTYWLAQREGPPLPFNPFFNLRAYEIDPANHVYLIDDTLADYEALEAERMEAMSAGLLAETAGLDEGGVVLNGFEPPGYEDNFYVNSLTLSNGFLVFGLDNLTPGHEYLVTRKKVLDEDFTNYWVPEWAFTAAAIQQTITIPLPTDSDTGFFRIVDYDLYQGPSLTIVSPADNSTVSGTLQVRCTLTDIFQPVWAELYVDGNFHAQLEYGELSFNVDSAKLANGPHVFSVVLSSLIPIDADSAFQAEYSVSLSSVTTSNWFAAGNIPQAFTASLGAVPYPFETTTPAVCQLTVRDAFGGSVRTMWFTNEFAGPFVATWDLTKDDTTPVDVPGTYTVTAIAWPFPELPSNGVPIVFPTALHPRLHAGFTATFRAKLQSWDPFGFDSNYQSQLDDITSALYWSTRAYYSDPDGFVRTVNPSCPSVFYQNSDLANYYTITTNLNTGHVIWVGHGGPNKIGSGDMTLITQDILLRDVAEAYGNAFNASTGDYLFGAAGKRGRMRYAELNGCNTANGNWCWAFGTPKRNLDADGNLVASTFCGWSVRTSTGGGWPWADTPYDRHVRSLQAFWSAMGIDSPGIRNASHEAFYYYGDEGLIPYFKIIGSRNMTWKNP